MVSDPNIAILLIGLGILGIAAEFCLPGKVVPGVAGGVSLLVGIASVVNSAGPVSWTWALAVGAPVVAALAALLTVARRARRNKRLL